jgi:hypothetical protein
MLCFHPGNTATQHTGDLVLEVYTARNIISSSMKIGTSEFDDNEYMSL